MHRVIVLLSCDSCGRLHTTASVGNQESPVSWKAAVSVLQDDVDVQFDLLRSSAKRSGWHCEDPCILCFECAANENSFLDMLVEMTQEDKES